MDALSDVLNSVRLEGAVYLNAEFTAPWCIRGELGLASVRQRLVASEHVAFFHFLTEGRCKVRLADGGEVLEASGGDLILFPKEGKHLMGTDLQLAPMEAQAALTPDPEPESGAELFNMRHGGGGAATRFVCGYLALSRSVFRPLLEALPRLVCIQMGAGPAAAMLRELFRAGVRESAALRPGAGSMLAKLAELLFVQALRCHITRLPPGGQGRPARGPGGGVRPAAGAGSPECAAHPSAARSHCCTPRPAGTGPSTSLPARPRFRARRS